MTRRRAESLGHLVLTGPRARTVAARVRWAAMLRERTLGLLALPRLEPGEALWLEPCGSIHTWGMGYPIDALFLDRDLRVLRVIPGLRPWRIGWAPRGTRSVVELPAGGADGVEVGDRLEIRESEPLTKRRRR